MQVYGLLGNPVGHSRSPPMHEAAYDELDMDARYVTFEPGPDAIGPAIEGAKTLGIRGVNVTIPFKEDALSHVEPDALATQIGAVNTIDFSTPTPTGHNTDAEGARRAFERHGVPLGGKSAVLVGAGGAARAIAFMLADEGATVAIANRTVSRAVSLADAVNGVGDSGLASAHGLDELPELVSDADVLVNATSVGMESEETPISTDALHADLAVMDAVYSPVETRLLREASACGATTIDGAWMLLFQGVAAFELWTGRNAPVERMDAALRRRL